MDTKQTDQDEGSGCQHHWVIDPPKGPVSKGVCRSCGEERDFPGRRRLDRYAQKSWSGRLGSGDYKLSAAWNRPTRSRKVAEVPGQ